MLVLLVAAVLLLLPDVSSIEIPGIVRLEREVAEQRRIIQNLRFQSNIYNINERERTVAKITQLVDENPDKFKSFMEEDEQLVQEPATQDQPR
jgi:hypothetical protein